MTEVHRMSSAAPLIIDPMSPSHRIKLKSIGSYLLTNFNRYLFHRNHQMEMVRHQAPGQNIAVRRHIFPYFIKEKQVILVREKYRLRVISAVIHVVNMSFGKFHSNFCIKLLVLVQSHKKTGGCRGRSVCAASEGFTSGKVLR